MRIAIATTGRFHVLDLARELSALGHDVTFYSYVPKSRALKFGLPPECHVGLLPFVFPLVALEWALGRWARPTLSKWLRILIDRVLCLTLRPCDVFIAMSGMYLSSAKAARERFGAKILIERGSRHIHSQEAILREAGIVGMPSQFDVESELASYRGADRVVVPSLHAYDSFLEQGFAPERIFVNPYGVDSERFSPPVEKDSNRPPTAIFVGAWSRQKGADLAVRAIGLLDGIGLEHVGPIVDVPFPKSAAFQHRDAVDQLSLPQYYHRADVFILPSRQEGLSLVIAQALGCGLPVVCTPRTGGSDLKVMIEHPEAIITVGGESPDALADGIRRAFEVKATLGGQDLLGMRGRKALSWKAYGQRYHDFLVTLGAPDAL